ncbi:MAG: precorrin-2 C(20)-methyltransferase [Alphaproteobacteria bacterium]|nr:precorrin-2 C(20)-methyltransferase [Alphaproteobacteria bacterium]
MIGTLYGVGVGPGDPELMTLKAVRIIGAGDVVAYFSKRGKAGNSRTIADKHIRPTAEQIRLEYPYTTEIPVSDPRYTAALDKFYDDSANRIDERLRRGQNVVVLCEGDPFFYGSFMHLYDRLNGEHETEVVPGITSMSGCWTRAGTPMTRGNECLSVLAGTIDENQLVQRLENCEAAVIMKVGRNLPKVRSALSRAGLAERAIFVERGTMSEERIIRLCEKPDDRAPYFSLVLVPGRQAGQ